MGRLENAGLLANREAEEAVIGALVVDPSALALVRPKLGAADFSSPYLASVYSAILALADEGRAIDYVTLADAIAARGGDPAPVLEAVNATPSALHAAHYAQIVAELALRRRMLDASARIAALAADEGRDSDVVLGEAFSLLRAVSDRGQATMLDSATAASEFADELARWVASPGDVWGLPTGLRDLDALTGGLDREFVIIAGRPSHGKSALMLQIARHLAGLGHGVAFFSLEMGVRALMLRLACLETQIDSMAVRTGKLSGDEERRIYDALARISKLPIFWHVKSAPTVGEIQSEVTRLRLQHEISVVVVDYLQLMGGSRRDNRNLELGEISRGLANLSHNEGLLVMAGSQLNRQIENRDVKVPRLADLRESGNIEQDADKVIFVHRDEIVFRQELRPVPPELRGKAKIILAKNRNGVAHVGLRDVVFFERWGQFADAAWEGGDAKAR